MPQANVWIKKENWDAWIALEDKSGFINAILARPEAPQPPLYEKLKQAQEARDVKFCQHDQVKGFCKKGCK